MDSDQSPHDKQGEFFNRARRETSPVTIYLTNGKKLTGRIRSFDRFTVVLESNRLEQLIINGLAAQNQVAHAFGKLVAGAGQAATDTGEEALFLGFLLRRGGLNLRRRLRCSWLGSRWRYSGVMMETRCPRSASAFGRLAATSPRPPVLENGATSLEAKRMSRVSAALGAPRRSVLISLASSIGSSLGQSGSISRRCSAALSGEVGLI